MQIILDADIIVYEAATNAEITVCWDGDFYSTMASLNNAKAKFDDIVDLWVSGAAAAMEKPGSEAEIIFAFSDPDRPNAYRKQLDLVEYKAQRLGMKRPLVCRDLEEWAIETYEGLWEPTLEGDDICGLLQGSDTVVVTHDKDLLQVPGFVWYPRKQELERVTQESGDLFFYTQVLTGDRVDGYTGIPNCGPVAAKKVTDSDEFIMNPWEAVVEAYRKKGLSEEFALANARCARILRDVEYDWNTKEVTLWTP